MAYFEYRLFAESKGFPVLFGYESMAAEEAALRFACDRFVKEGRVYEKTSAANEDDSYVVYVEEKRNVPSPLSGPPLTGREIVVELREFADFANDYPLVHIFRCNDLTSALLYVMADYVYVADNEWLKIRSEVDEDRECYIIYARKT